MAELRPRVVPIVALDVPDAASAYAMIDKLGDSCAFYKIGSELFTAEGPAIVRGVRQRGAEVFLDLKFHDIPNTVKGAARSVAGLGVRLLTVHASGGAPMIASAVAGVHEAGGTCEVLAVSVLTSLDADALGTAWGRQIADVEAEVVRLAGLALGGGAKGLVCSGREAAAVRRHHGSELALLIPGVRLAGDTHQDQARVVTPREAARAGATYIVLGRAVTAAESPRNAMARVLADLS